MVLSVVQVEDQHSQKNIKWRTKRRKEKRGQRTEVTDKPRIVKHDNGDATAPYGNARNAVVILLLWWNKAFSRSIQLSHSCEVETTGCIKRETSSQFEFYRSISMIM